MSGLFVYLRFGEADELDWIGCEVGFVECLADVIVDVKGCAVDEFGFSEDCSPLYTILISSKMFSLEELTLNVDMSLLSMCIGAYPPRGSIMHSTHTRQTLGSSVAMVTTMTDFRTYHFKPIFDVQAHS